MLPDETGVDLTVPGGTRFLNFAGGLLLNRMDLRTNRLYKLILERD